MSKKLYEVLEVKGKSGLTLGAHVVAPGGKFTREAWPYSEEKLKIAIEQKRCKLAKSKNLSDDKKPTKATLKKELKALEKEYSTIEDSESEEAKDILSKIEDLEEELK